MAESIPELQHNIEIHENFKSWQRKPLLQKIYLQFYQTIASHVNLVIEGKIVELGSGIGNMKMVIPEVICTDIFENPWIDQVENAYSLSFDDSSVSNLILFDVWHHLKFPGSALEEFNRVLKPGGQIIIFEPSISFFGFLVFGLLHHEPISFFKKIDWLSDPKADEQKKEYYAAQGNASRIFLQAKYRRNLDAWIIKSIRRYAAFSYVLSGGYSKKQLYPTKLFPLLLKFDSALSILPSIFATRMLIVLEKK